MYKSMYKESLFLLNTFRKHVPSGVLGKLLFLSLGGFVSPPLNLLYNR